jgi:chloramphenicol 3-O phosphotransferase
MGDGDAARQQGIVVYLNGTSSSGKTALAGELHKTLPGPWLNVEADRFFGVLSHPEPWVVQPVVAALHAFVACAGDGGVGAIVDGLLTMRDWLKDAVDQLADRRAFLVGVRCSPEELERREAARGNRRPGNAREQLAFVHAHGVYDVEIDTSRAAPEECAARLAAWLATEPEPAAFRRLRASSFLSHRGAYGWVLRRGSVGPGVERLQEDLRRLGHDPGPTDGVFGEQTEAALRAFQLRRGLPTDGVVGWPRTIAAILEEVPPAG